MRILALYTAKGGTGKSTAAARIRMSAPRWWRLLLIASAVAAGISCTACDSIFARDRWLGTVYPDGCCPAPRSRHIGEFASLDECRVACVTYLRDVRHDDEELPEDDEEESEGDYVCGLNCRDAALEKGPAWAGMRICEETTH